MKAFPTSLNAVRAAGYTNCDRTDNHISSDNYYCGKNLEPERSRTAIVSLVGSERKVLYVSMYGLNHWKRI